MNRRTFLQLLSIGGAAALAPTLLFAKSDVYGWRFGVWTILNRRGSNYWCQCDCRAERAVSLQHLLSVNALSCDHVRVRGYFCLGSDAALYCQNCGEQRRFFFNGQGLRIRSA